jgi:hypothetical protein
LANSIGEHHRRTPSANTDLQRLLNVAALLSLSLSQGYFPDFSRLVSIIRLVFGIAFSNRNLKVSASLKAARF